jgi:hypothetical protein
MATTRIIKHHISRGETIAASLADRLGYGLNPDKTQGGELIRAYECDHETADAEFLLSKAQYQAVTGREQKRDADVLCYQIRQSFKPGEVTPEQANAIGYDFAMRWTKGRHAFFVATHIDRRHIHNHVYYNSTALDCTRKFRDFLGSARAVRRLSDRICLENSLSVIADPKLKSKGRYRHYGEWLGDGKPLTFQQRLKAAIDAALAGQPEDFDAFLAFMEAAGFEHKWGRGSVLSFRIIGEGQERYTRLRAATLGNGYGLEDIRAAIEGRGPAPGRAALPGRRGIPAPRKVNLVIDIQEKMRDGKGPAYARWATVYNLKQMAAALQYIQENNLLDYGDLEAKAEAATERFHSLGNKLKQTEAAMTRNADLKAAIADYARTRSVFAEYKARKYSRAYLAEHDADIAVYRAAQTAMRELLNGERLPKMDTLKAEWRELTAAKKSGYTDYRAAQKDMREIVAIKANIDHLLGVTGRDKNKEQER